MCYFVSIGVNFKIIETRFGARFVQSESFSPIYSASGFTSPEIPAITNKNPESIVSLRWGLIPFWVKDIEAANKIRQQTLNARAETIFEKPAFRHLIMSKRCLVLVDGFFEWRHENKKAYPYYIHLAHHVPFALAGIWDTWKNPETGERTRTCAIITTKANPLLEKIHNLKKRMPVILPQEKEKLWLKAGLEKEVLQDLLVPYDETDMEGHTVPNLIARLGLNTEKAEVIEKMEYPGLAPI
jgi:putative SOS response-associated peptidase YedK